MAFDVWFSESSLADSGAIEQTLADLLARDAPDKPEDVDEWKVAYEADGATWLRSTVFGDDKDRVLVKTDGEYTYLLPDIAYHRDKFARGFELLINVWGADHHGYVSRLKNAVQALGHDPDELEIVITQLVSLFKNGEPVRLSKRTGQIVTIDEIVDEIGADSARHHLPAPVDGQPADRRPGRGGQPGHGEPGLLRAVRPRPDPVHRAQGGRAGGRAGPAG